MKRNVFDLLPEFLRETLAMQGISVPTPVQDACIEAVLKGRDVLATAQTGTGKTLAFLLPLAVLLQEDAQNNALILSPTRELAQQTYDEWRKLTEAVDLPAVLIIGGDNIHKQFADLRKKPRMIIATPGRVIDHMQRKSIDLRQTHTLVLDETDRMLDMGFVDDMRRIVSFLPSPRHTLLFSATLPEEINRLAREFLVHPLRVQIGSVVSAAEHVLQEIVYLDVREKLPQLLHELNTRCGSILIFTKTKHGAERLAKQLKLYGQKCNALHGDLRQNRRRQVLDFFRNQTVRILVATDVAARGIDVTHIAHVINYDLPQSPEDYIHRIGRTGRAGSVGNAISFIVGDEEKWKEICKVTRFATQVKTVHKTIDPLPAPKFVAQEEGNAHSKNRRSKRSLPSAATQRAKELLRSGEVYLPQGKEITKDRQRKNSQSQTLSAKRTEKQSHPVSAVSKEFPVQEYGFRKLQVGVSKKKLHKKKTIMPARPSKQHKFKKFR